MHYRAGHSRNGIRFDRSGRSLHCSYSTVSFVVREHWRAWGYSRDVVRRSMSRVMAPIVSRILPNWSRSKGYFA